MASARDEQLVVTVARTTILVINTLHDSMENIFQTLYITYLHSEAVYTTLVKVRLQFYNYSFRKIKHLVFAASNLINPNSS